jgi:hypothetical protein
VRFTDVQRWPSRRWRRGGARFVLVALVLTLLAPAASARATPSGPQPAEAISQCTRSAGVLVAVDFSYWGDSVERGCSPTPTTGLDALGHAGFSVTGTAQYGDKFICRLDNRPTPKQQSCQSTPSTDAYWSYWHAQAGQNTWAYSSEGAYAYKPPAGSVDAWTYGSGAKPTFTPAEVRAGSAAGTTTTSSTTTTTTTTAAPTTTTTATPATTTTTAEKARHRSSDSTTTTDRRDSHPKAKAKRHPTHKAAAHFPKKGPPKSVPTTSPPTTIKIVNVAGGATRAPPSKGGSPVGLIVGLILALAVAAVAVGTVLRRRRPAR